MGEAASAASGNTIASISNRIAAARFTDSSGADSRTTGSRAMPDIIHNGSSRARTATATTAARIGGVANATTKMRCSLLAGQIESLMAARLGWVASALSTTGIAI